MSCKILCKGAIAGFAVLVLASCAVPALAAVDMFVKIEGIGGESLDREHSGWIEVESFSWEQTEAEMSGQRASLAGTREGIPVMPGSLTITKYGDKASTPLMQACSSGTDLGNVVVEVVETTEETGLVLYSTYTLSGVRPSGCSPSDSEGRPTETITLNYKEITYKYTQVNRKAGKPAKKGP